MQEERPEKRREQAGVEPEPELELEYGYESATSDESTNAPTTACQVSSGNEERGGTPAAPAIDSPVSILPYLDRPGRRCPRASTAFVTPLRYGRDDIRRRVTHLPDG